MGGTHKEVTKVKVSGCIAQLWAVRIHPLTFTLVTSLLNLKPRDTLAAGLYLLMPAEAVQERFSEHENKFRLMQQPAQPSDLRPVEHPPDEMA